MSDTCPNEHEYLPLLLDGDPGDARRAAAEAHVASCATCRAALAAQRGLAQALQAWEVPAVDPQLSVAFAARLAAHRQPRWHGWAWAGSALAALTVAAIILAPRPAPPVAQMAPPMTLAIHPREEARAATNAFAATPPHAVAQNINAPVGGTNYRPSATMARAKSARHAVNGADTATVTRVAVSSPEEAVQTLWAETQ